jgi:hypothetical protein
MIGRREQLNLASEQIGLESWTATHIHEENALLKTSYDLLIIKHLLDD